MFYRGKYADPSDPRETGFKRQRLVDQGPSSFYPPDPSYLYSHHHHHHHLPLVPQPPLLPPFAIPPFPAVRLRGLPFDCTESEVLDFLHGLDVVDVLFVRRHGKPTGEAYCLLGYPLQVDFALGRNRHNIGRRYVEVFHSRRDEYYRAVANEVCEADARVGSPHRGARPRAGSVGEGERERERGDMSDFGEMVRMRGLPYSATREDVMAFFEGFRLTEGRIHLLGNGKGRPAGEAIVEFGSVEESRDAVMAKDRRTLGNRYIELFPASREDLEEAASRGRLLPKSFDGMDQIKATPIVRMRGLPYSAGKDDIIDFFKNFSLSDESVHIVSNFDGRPTGEAFVEFVSVDDAKEALAKDRMTLGNRYVELFQSSPEELNEALSRGR